MSADRWNEALEAAAKECANQKFVGFREIREVYSAACADCANAILALREDDQRGAAATTGAEKLSEGTGSPESRTGKPVPAVQSAPLHPGRQKLASSDPEGHLQAMSDAELPAPASPGPDYCEADHGYCLLCGSLPMGGGCWRGLPLAAAEEEQ